jgi:2-succinyl-5-enolpyruvyl-6-hydroxy-3-cyclohexene-1-carboxylate synthase
VDDRNYRFTVSLVAAFAELGVLHAAVTPGSRNTPLSMTLASEPRIQDRSFHDERSAGFFALGAGKAGGRPALVVCTSGTAAAELHPAVVEARYGRVPLLVVTADRPSDLWETGAPQTIDQRRLYGSAALWSHDLDVPAPGDAPDGLPAGLAARMVAAARSGPGPVHLNLRFREPLVPAPGPLPDPAGPVPRLELGERVAPDGAVAALGRALQGRRGLIVAGPHHSPGLAIAAAEAALVLGFPILADPQTGLRRGPHVRDRVMSSGAALSDAGVLDRLVPEVVLRIGAPPTSKSQWSWLAAHPEVPQVHLDDAGWRDPGATVHMALRADPAATLRSLADAGPRPAPGGWTESWAEADRRAAEAIGASLAGQEFPTEPLVARIVTSALPGGSLLYTASSMPIRDVDLCMESGDRPLRIAANRGANGIDGLLSSGLGAAAAWEGPVAVLAGDLSALHDLTALAEARRGAPVTFVIVDNDGGGIFHFLPQAAFPEVFERHFGTPHGLDLAAAARALGLDVVEPASSSELEEFVSAPPERSRVAVVRTDRAANPAHHREILTAVEAALDG